MAMAVHKESGNPYSRSPKPLERVRLAVQTRHYSHCTEEAYVYWIKGFVLFHHKRHPLSMREKEISQFLTHLAVQKKVSAATQNQAQGAPLNARNQPNTWRRLAPRLFR